MLLVLGLLLSQPDMSVYAVEVQEPIELKETKPSNPRGEFPGRLQGGGSR